MITEGSIHYSALKKIFPFSSLDDESLKRITPFFEQVVFPAGATIISDGYPASDLFFILSGKVKLVYHHKKGDVNLGVLNSGDCFGEESLNSGSVYETRAVCQTRVTAIKIKGAKTRALRDAYSDINIALSMMQKTFRLTCKEKLRWREETESVDLISRRHPFFLFLRILLTGGTTLLIFFFLLFAALASEDFFIPLLVVSLIVFIVGGLLCFWAAMEWRNDYLILTNGRICVQKKLIGFYDSRHESPINAILSVGIDTSLTARILGYGTVTVRTYTGDLQFKRLPYPYTILEFIENRRDIAQAQANQEERGVIREVITSSTGRTMDSSRKQAKDAQIFKDSNSYQSGSFSDFLARFFHLREEKENTVTYHTHWWILLRKTFIPGAFLLAIVVLVLLRLIGFIAAIPETVIYIGGLILALIGWVWWFYQLQDWQNDVYILTDDQLIDVYRKPLGNEDRRSSPVRNIQTVEFERKGLISLLLNFGTVKIKIGNEELSFDNVYQPSQVQSEIYARYRFYQEKSKRSDQERFVEWIKTYDELRQEKETFNREAKDDEKG